MSKVWLISDTHFFHEKIIEYEDRPFDSVDLMNAAIVTKWNNLIAKDDLVYHLGDVTFNNWDESFKIFSKLNGKKILVRGNHDKRRSDNWFKKLGFSYITKHPIIVDDFYILSHEPVYLTKSMPYVNIHGHIHSKTITGANYFNVSVECHNYAPVEFRTIKKHFSGKVGNQSLLDGLKEIHDAD